MALPSQQARGSGSAPRLTGGRSRRRRGRGRRLFVAAVLVGGVGLLVWQWPSLFGTPDAGAGETERHAEADDSSRNESAARLVVEQTDASPLTPAREREEERPAPSARGAGREVAMGTPVADPVERTPERPVVATPESARDVLPGASVGTTPAVRDALARAEAHLSANRPVDARDVLNRALFRTGTSATDRDVLRARLAELAERLTFSARVYPDDDTTTTYTVRSGDALSAIPVREGFAIDHRVIQRINGIDNPNRIRVGQTLKVLDGPFHAVVDKSAFRLDLYAEQTDSAGNRLYIRSFPVGLGEYGSTPVGSWVVRDAGKVVNPAWVNPRTGEKWDKDDPEIPIGERWIGLRGTDPETELMEGYGIHGTSEPETIGMERSMGCVRMLADDVDLVYALLSEGKSTVLVVD